VLLSRQKFTSSQIFDFDRSFTFLAFMVIFWQKLWMSANKNSTQSPIYDSGFLLMFYWYFLAKNRR